MAARKGGGGKTPAACIHRCRKAQKIKRAGGLIVWPKGADREILERRQFLQKKRTRKGDATKDTGASQLSKCGSMMARRRWVPEERIQGVGGGAGGGKRSTKHFVTSSRE